MGCMPVLSTTQLLKLGVRLDIVFLISSSTLISIGYFISHMQCSIETTKYVELRVVSVSDRVEVFLFSLKLSNILRCPLHVCWGALGEHKSRGSSSLPLLALPVSIHVHSQECVCFFMKNRTCYFVDICHTLQALCWTLACIVCTVSTALVGSRST